MRKCSVRWAYAEQTAGATPLGGELLKTRSAATKLTGPVPPGTHDPSGFHIRPVALLQ